jgi:hypothetical protein
MKWLLRLVFLRLLGGRAAAILVLFGLIRAIRGARAEDVDRADPRSGRTGPRSPGRTGIPR